MTEPSPLFLNSSPDGVFAFDRDCRLQCWNPQMEKMTGIPAGQVLGKNAFEALPLLKEKDQEVFFQMALEGKEGTSWNWPYPQIAGKELHECRFFAIRDDQGRVEGGAGVLRQAATPVLREVLERQEKLQRFAEVTEEAIMIHDQGVIVDANPAMARMLGYELSEIVGRHVSEFADEGSVRKTETFLEQGYPRESYEYTARRKDGTTFPMEIHGRDFVHQGRKLRVSSGWDITYRKKAEQALHESEERLHRLYDVTKEGIFIHDRGIIRDANPSLAQMLKAELKDLVGRNCLEFLEAASQQTAKGYIEKGYPEETYELEVKRTDGTLFPAEIYGRTFEWDGKPLRVVSVWDITERKIAEEILKESEERFRRFSQVSKEGILIHDQGNIVDVNPSLCRMLGYGYDELIGHNTVEFLSSESVERVLKMRKEGYPDEPYEAEMRRKDGTGCPIEAHGHNFNWGGKVLRVSSIWDITERKKAQAALLRFERLSAVGRMAAGMAHEIRNPLAAISASAQLLKMGVSKDKKGGDYLQSIIDHCQQINRLVLNALEYSRTDKPENLQVVQATEAMENALNLAQLQLGSRHRKVKVAWGQRKEARFKADPTRIRQVLVNLIVNAYESMIAEGVLTLETTADGRWTCLRVGDTGPGIKPEDLKNIFEPFFTTKDSGSGLGLAISQNIAQQHGGDILVEPVEPHGAIFTLKLPQAV